MTSLIARLRGMVGKGLRWNDSTDMGSIFLAVFIRNKYWRLEHTDNLG